DMIDVNTIVGDPVEAPDGTVIIPISRVTFGFASGGGEYLSSQDASTQNNDMGEEQKFPFAGGTGAGVSVQPVAFLVVGNAQMKLLPVDQNATLIDNLMSLVPQLLDKIQTMADKRKGNRFKKQTSENEMEE
ncbi:MAG TPA: sporulation protein YtfJ, partial [Clostridiales bacterium]|nr:sporulation protein YtfJ [Clostridiales bacterium]